MFFICKMQTTENRETTQALQYLRRAFEQRYQRPPEVGVASPGRVNIIGEHTDYNDGYVLPAAIDHHIYLLFAKNGTDTVNLYSLDYDQAVSVPLREVRRTESPWQNFIYGVVYQLRDRIEGFDLAFCGNVPEGAGLSSSAAICCGIGFGLNELFELDLQKWDLAKIAQKSEHDFALLNCGIMDQFACLFGQKGHALKLDCTDLTYEASEVDLAGCVFLLLNSMVKHSLGDSDYNRRREES
ncbi:MAG TPA: galactokinase, partial [Cytophagales bacterium]|nr:galactokinase [Cytophagales bacterium]